MSEDYTQCYVFICYEMQHLMWLKIRETIEAFINADRGFLSSSALITILSLLVLDQPCPERQVYRMFERLKVQCTL